MRSDISTSNAVTVLYFASLGERVGLEREILPLAANVRTVADLRDLLAQREGNWIALCGKDIRYALNHEVVPAHAPLKAGDEIAFFPPVTGG